MFLLWDYLPTFLLIACVTGTSQATSGSRKNSSLIEYQHPSDPDFQSSSSSNLPINRQVIKIKNEK